MILLNNIIMPKEWSSTYFTFLLIISFLNHIFVDILKYNFFPSVVIVLNTCILPYDVYYLLTSKIKFKKMIQCIEVHLMTFKKHIYKSVSLVFYAAEFFGNIFAIESLIRPLTRKAGKVIFFLVIDCYIQLSQVVVI